MKASQKEMQRFRQLCKAIREDCNYIHDAALDNDNFLNKFHNKYIPDYLCWIYDLQQDSLSFVGNTSNRLTPWNLTFKGFVLKIKECFRSHFIDAITCYFTILKKGDVSADNYLCISLPLKLEADTFLYSKVSIVPNIKGSILLGFALIVIPVKYYSSSTFYLELKLNGSVDTFLTKHIKKNIQPPNIKLTKKQLQILKLLSLGWKTERISLELGLSIDSIYKINGRLIFKLSEYYGMNFTTVKEAADFYYAPFS